MLRETVVSIYLLQVLDEVSIKENKYTTHASMLEENLELLGWENWKQTVYG